MTERPTISKMLDSDFNLLKKGLSVTATGSQQAIAGARIYQLLIDEGTISAQTFVHVTEYFAGLFDNKNPKLGTKLYNKVSPIFGTPAKKYESFILDFKTGESTPLNRFKLDIDSKIFRGGLCNLRGKCTTVDEDSFIEHLMEEGILCKCTGRYEAPLDKLVPELQKFLGVQNSDRMIQLYIMRGLIVPKVKSSSNDFQTKPTTWTMKDQEFIEEWKQFKKDVEQPSTAIIETS